MNTLILPLLSLAFVSSITPGPNNLMLMASGANFGFRRTVPHMLGVALGFTFMVWLMGQGAAQVFARWPVLRTVLEGVSVLYMLWLAWKIAHASAPGEGIVGRPMTFLQAAAFQWVNPKAWAMALGAVTIYAALGPLAIAAIFGAVNLPSVSVWVLMGQGVRHWLAAPTRLRAFNWTMAALLVASLYPVLMH
jgi:threonine/homoserine/homoserine lactone efflux protein